MSMKNRAQKRKNTEAVELKEEEEEESCSLFDPPGLSPSSVDANGFRFILKCFLLKGFRQEKEGKIDTHIALVSI